MSTITELIPVAPVIVNGASTEQVADRPAGKVSLKPWKGYERVLFRIAFLFFIVLSLPNSWEWYKMVVRIDWSSLHYRDLYDVARFGSGITLFGNTLFGSPLAGYAQWIITLLVAIAGGLVWTLIVRRRKTERKEYNILYYWLRVVVRYRAGIGIIGFGFTKLLPVQMPYPSLGVLNTQFGDLTAQKIYWLSVGIVPWYQVFAGVVELTAGTMLLFRKTTTLGSVLLLGALGTIVYVNFAYDGGVHVYSSYFVLLAAFLLVDDVPRIYNLLVREKFTVPVHIYPSFSQKWQRYSRTGLKVLTLFLFLGVLFYLQLVNFLYDPYKQPAVAGVKKLRGNYTVSEFRLNNTLIPYSPLDSVRWQEATFEDWTTLTFRVNKPTPLDLSNGGGDPQRDINRTFEVSGVAGGQRVFHYQADETAQTLYLQDKYKAVPDRRNRTSEGSGESVALKGGEGEKGGEDLGEDSKATRQSRHASGQQGNEGEGQAAGRKGGEGGKGKEASRQLGIEGKTGGGEKSERGVAQGGEARGASLAASAGSLVAGKGKRSQGKKDTADNWIPADALARIGDERTKIHPLAASTRRDREFATTPKNEKRNRMILHYETTDGSRVILRGINENKDSIYIVLDRVDRKYTLSRSGLQAGSY